jgi:fatty acid desaturase
MQPHLRLSDQARSGKSFANFILDDYVSPKVLAGPHASEASRATAAAVRNDPQYRELVGRLRTVGFFDASPWSFAWRIALCTGAYLGAFAYMLVAPSLWQRLAACCVIGVAHLRGNFLAHDGSHGAITKNQRVVSAIGHWFDTVLGGYSFVYHRRVHDLHHYHCNEVDRDPNAMARLFALHDGLYGDKNAFTRLTARFQHYIMVLGLPLWSFALRGESVAYVLRNWRKTRLDAVLLVAHVALWTVLPVVCLGWWNAALCYAVMTAVTGVYLGMIVPVNHLAMPSLEFDTAPSFLHQQLATTRNITSSPLHDWIFIGQNSQIEHHLFPWAPTFKLGRGRAIVREFCREHGIEYHETSFGTALREVRDHVLRLARQATAPEPAAAAQPQPEPQPDLMRRAS